MTADIARITFDPTRQYRSVIAQQGRVTLEADSNESAAIASEALRLETIDVIGPTGTPDDGYKVGSGNGPGGASIGPGVFYLGGWRLELDSSIDLTKQPDWVDMPPSTTAQGNLVVALLLTEQSVSATEDLALREVALGGPDSAARMRLMQQFLRVPTDGNTCAAGAATVSKLLAAEGITIDAATLQLMSAARLQAGFVPGPPQTDPCTPAAAGGYLGADNQLVRVTVIAFDAAAKTGTLLWGWNNASLLYRAKMTTPRVLTLVGTPVDEEHAPQLGQVVEILRSRADMGDGNFVAAPEGFVTTLTQAYSFDTGQLELATALPAEYQADKNPLFVRLWQTTVPFTAGQATPLNITSGITVTITLPALPTSIALRPFWRFAVRPNTPVQIYPQRYQEKPQPPDGPRQWLTDLAVVHAQAKGSIVLADCRVPFVPLTQQQNSKCCGLVLGPKDVDGRGGLQAVLDGLAGTQSSVALLPGAYTLPQPLLLGKQHSGLTLEGCGPGAVLSANSANLAAFRFGLVVLDQASNIALRRLSFAIPDVPLAAAGTATTGAAVAPATGVGILAVASPGLTVEGCTFNSQPHSPSLFGVQLFVLGEATGLTIRGNHFASAKYQTAGAIFGVLASVLNTNVSVRLDNAELSDNTFEHLSAGLVTFAQLGLVRCTGNRVIQCGTGLYFASSNIAATAEVTRQAAADAAHGTAMSPAMTAGMQPMMLASVLTQATPFAAKAPPPPSPAMSDDARNVLLTDVATRGTTAYRNIISMAGAAQPAATQPQAAAAAVIDANLTHALNAVRDVSLASEIAGVTLKPVLHLAGNDVTLIPTQGTPGVGIGIVFAARKDAGTVLLSANRVITADVKTEAAGILFPTVAAVTGNVFMQTGSAGQAGAVPGFMLVAESGEIEVTGNVIHAGATIAPARSNPAPTNTWNFLNTVG